MPTVKKTTIRILRPKVDEYWRLHPRQKLKEEAQMCRNGSASRPKKLDDGHQRGRLHLFVANCIPNIDSIYPNLVSIVKMKQVQPGETKHSGKDVRLDEQEYGLV